MLACIKCTRIWSVHYQFAEKGWWELYRERCTVLLWMETSKCIFFLPFNFHILTPKLYCMVPQISCLNRYCLDLFYLCASLHKKTNYHYHYRVVPSSAGLLTTAHNMYKVLQRNQVQCRWKIQSRQQEVFTCVHETNAGRFIFKALKPGVNHQL